MHARLFAVKVSEYILALNWAASRTELSDSNGSFVMPATVAESLAFSAARNFSMKLLNSFCKAAEAAACLGAWAKAGTMWTSAAASTILNKTFMVWLRNGGGV